MISLSYHPKEHSLLIYSSQLENISNDVVLFYVVGRSSFNQGDGYLLSIILCTHLAKELETELEHKRATKRARATYGRVHCIGTRFTHPLSATSVYYFWRHT